MAAEMIERVAKFKSDFDKRNWLGMRKFERKRYMARAKAAIAAMREPTEEILEVGLQALHEVNSMNGVGDVKDMWQAMIDAALKE